LAATASDDLALIIAREIGSFGPGTALERAATEEAFRKAARAAEADLIVLDQGLLGSATSEGIRLARSSRPMRPLQVILALSGPGLDRAKASGETGADDFLGPGAAESEMGPRLKAARIRLDEHEKLVSERDYYKRVIRQEEALSSGLVDLSATLKDSARAVAEVKRALRKANRALEVKERDALTGLMNRAGLMERAREAVREADSGGAELSGFMLDLDRFKEINDLRGHQAGDAVLSAVGRRLAACLRREDFAGRYGGEEFFAVLKGSDRAAAAAIAQRVRAAMESLSVAGDGEGSPALRVTASIGVAQYRPGEGLEAWIGRADGAMYDSKRSGRNAVSLG
jgi:diguanylate cyclase (GGDEF)-like protein